LHVDACTGARMRETQASRVQKDASQRLEKNSSGTHLPRRSIQSIAGQRMPGESKMRANLVGAPRARLGFHQTEIPDAQKYPPVRLCRASAAEPCRHPRAALRIARDGPLERSGVAAQAAMNQSDVRLAYGARPELFAESPMRGVIAGGHNDSGCAAIETMHNSRPEVSSQRGESAEMMEQRVHEGALRGAGARVHDHSRGLIHHDHILILVEYVDRYLFRSRSQRRARQDLDIDEVAGHDTLRSPRQTFANADAALVDQLLNASAAQIGKA